MASIEGPVIAGAARWHVLQLAVTPTKSFRNNFGGGNFNGIAWDVDCAISLATSAATMLSQRHSKWNRL